MAAGGSGGGGGGSGGEGSGGGRGGGSGGGGGSGSGGGGDGLCLVLPAAVSLNAATLANLRVQGFGHQAWRIGCRVREACFRLVPYATHSNRFSGFGSAQASTCLKHASLVDLHKLWGTSRFPFPKYVVVNVVQELRHPSYLLLFSDHKSVSSAISSKSERLPVPEYSVICRDLGFYLQYSISGRSVALLPRTFLSGRCAKSGVGSGFIVQVL